MICLRPERRRRMTSSSSTRTRSTTTTTTRNHCSCWEREASSPLTMCVSYLFITAIQECSIYSSFYSVFSNQFQLDFFLSVFIDQFQLDYFVRICILFLIWNYFYISQWSNHWRIRNSRQWIKLIRMCNAEMILLLSRCEVLWLLRWWEISMSQPSDNSLVKAAHFCSLHFHRSSVAQHSRAQSDLLCEASGLTGWLGYPASLLWHCHAPCLWRQTAKDGR